MGTCLRSPSCHTASSFSLRRSSSAWTIPFWTNSLIWVSSMTWIIFFNLLSYVKTIDSTRIMLSVLSQSGKNNDIPGHRAVFQCWQLVQAILRHLFPCWPFQSVYTSVRWLQDIDCLFEIMYQNTTKNMQILFMHHGIFWSILTWFTHRKCGI